MVQHVPDARHVTVTALPAKAVLVKFCKCPRAFIARLPTMSFTTYDLSQPFLRLRARQALELTLPSIRTPSQIMKKIHLFN